MTQPEVTIHATADVSPNAEIGVGTRIWHQAQVREGARIGRECIIGKGAYVDANVVIGDRCKLQNSVFVYHGFQVEDGVFVGPGVMLLNDKRPRAINLDGSLQSDADWKVSEGRVERGAAIGGGSILLPGVRVGAFAMVGAGSVVSRDVPAHGLVFGNPARLQGWVCFCGSRLSASAEAGRQEVTCAECGSAIVVGREEVAP